MLSYQNRHLYTNQLSNEVPRILNGRIRCTACPKQINPFLKNATFEHPVLEVLLCKSCYDYYNSGDFTKDADDIDEYCRWCGDGGSLLLCDHCTNAFCRACVRRNLTRSESNKILAADDWTCFVCDPTPIKEIRSKCKLLSDAIAEYEMNKKSSNKPRRQATVQRVGSSIGAGDNILDGSKVVIKPGSTSISQHELRSCGTSPASSSAHPLQVWRSDCLRKLQDIKSDLSSLTSQFEADFHHPAKDVAEKKAAVRYMKLRTIKEVQTHMKGVMATASQFLRLIEEERKEVKVAPTYSPDNETTTGKESDYDDSDEEILSSPSKRKLLRKRRDRERLRSVSSPDPFQKLFKSFRQISDDSDEKTEPVEQILNSNVINNDTDSSKNMKETRNAAASESDIFDDDECGKFLPPVDSATISESENSSVNPRPVVGDGEEDASKLKQDGTASGKSSSDASDVSSVSEDQKIPSEIMRGSFHMSCGSESSPEDVTREEEINRIALKNLENQQMIMEEESEDSSRDDDEDCLPPHLVEKKTKGSAKSDEEILNNSKYKNRLLNIRLSLSDCESDSKMKKCDKRKTSEEESKELPAKRVKKELNFDEALADPNLSDEDALLLNGKDEDTGLDESKISDGDEDILLSDKDAEDTKDGPDEKSVDVDEEEGECGSHPPADFVAIKEELHDDESSEAEFSLKSLWSQKRSKSLRLVSSDDELPKLSQSPADRQSMGKIGRRNIRKILEDGKLSQDTQLAEMKERERRKRIEESLDNEEVIVIDDDSSPVKKPFTTRFILSKHPLVEVDPELVQVLKDHQFDGVKFMWRNVIESIPRANKEKGDGCILAHCMGLGKTLQVVTFLHTILNCDHLPTLRTALVICPLGTVSNWSHEFKHWTCKCDKRIKFDDLLQVKNDHDRLSLLRRWRNRGGVMIIGYRKYQLLCRGKNKMDEKHREILLQTLQDPGPDIVVCDEGHMIKNDKTDLSMLTSKIKTRRRIVLTGTPLQNNLKEYHCMVSFVKPRLLGSKAEFSNRFVNPILNGQHVDSTRHDVDVMKKRSHVLHELLSGCVQRKDVSCLARHLQPKHEYVVFVRLSPLQVRLYETYLVAHKCNDLSSRKGCLFQDFINLLHVTSHPRVLQLAKLRHDNKTSAENIQDDLRSFIVDDNEEENEESDEGSVANLHEKSVQDLKKMISERGGSCWGCTDKQDLVETYQKLSNQSQANAGDDSCWFEAVLPAQDNLTKAIDHSAKVSLLLDILANAYELGDKVVVFSQSLLTLDFVEEVLYDESRLSTGSRDMKHQRWSKNVNYFRLDGQTKTDKRKENINSFNDPRNTSARLYLVSTKAGGIGINLVGANRAVIFDASWNPTHDIQSIFRIYRFGQDKPCFVYRLIAHGTMEEKIYDRQVVKQSLAFRVVDQQQIERHFTASDIADLYTFKPEPADKKVDENLKSAPPRDQVLAKLLMQPRTRDIIVSYHEHDTLLDHKVDEELTEAERKLAWDEYAREHNPVVKEGDEMLKLPLAAINELISLVQAELKKNQEFLSKCDEEPLCRVMLRLKVAQRDMKLDEMLEQASRVQMRRAMARRQLQETKRYLEHKLKQLRLCQRRAPAPPVVGAQIPSTSAMPPRHPGAYFNSTRRYPFPTQADRAPFSDPLPRNVYPNFGPNRPQFRPNYRQDNFPYFPGRTNPSHQSFR
ncbi:uncharacterized protein LOC143453580 isoform X2 [Clavelina lepadiformis]|uniref:uncharacterized protein LOC143453580 isoform X2 n=1 Tax=Clavelina lepadiformis TaxID=159417 RepID=UPI004042CE03